MKRRYSLLWKCNILMKKICCVIRGMFVQLEYESGKNLKILSGCVLDAPNIKFGKNVTLCSNIHIFGTGSLEIGDNVAIGDNTVICVADNVKIMDDTIIAANCYITDCNHGTHQGDLIRIQKMRIKPVTIHENVWIGCACNILAGADIGKGTVIAAGSTINATIDEEKFLVPKREVKIVDRI